MKTQDRLAYVTEQIFWGKNPSVAKEQSDWRSGQVCESVQRQEYLGSSLGGNVKKMCVSRRKWRHRLCDHWGGKSNIDMELAR